MGRSGALAIFLVFVLIGPALGAVAFGLLMSAESLLRGPGDGAAMLPLLASIMFVPLAYLAGGTQAVISGAAAALAALRRGRLEWWPGVTAAAVAGGVYASRVHEDPTVTAILLAVHVAAAVFSLLICRLMLGRAGAPRV